MDKRSFTVKESDSFRLRVELWECLSPKGLYSVNFINECLDKDGAVDFSGTYEFFLNKDELDVLSKEIAK